MTGSKDLFKGSHRLTVRTILSHHPHCHKVVRLVGHFLGVRASLHLYDFDKANAVIDSIRMTASAVIIPMSVQSECHQFIFQFNDAYYISVR